MQRAVANKRLEAAARYQHRAQADRGGGQIFVATVPLDDICAYRQSAKTTKDRPTYFVGRSFLIFKPIREVARELDQ
jgi:hypothetical protein